MAGETGGFYGSPVTKACCLIMGLSHLLLGGSFSKWTPLGMLRSLFQFTSTGELLWSLPLMYTFRALERRMGSSKFFAFLAMASGYSLATRMAIESGTILSTPASPSVGPYGPIFALFVLYYEHVPKMVPRRFSIFGINVSDKSFTYLFGIQLAWNQRSSSLISSAIGISFGLLYAAEVFPLHRIRVPSALAGVADRATRWFHSASPWETRMRRHLREQQQQQQQQMRRHGAGGGIPGGLQQQQQQMWANAMQQFGGAGTGTGPGAGPGAAGGMGPAAGAGGMPVVEPTEANIQNLVDMGFNRAEATAALRATQDNVEIGRAHV